MSTSSAVDEVATENAAPEDLIGRIYEDRDPRTEGRRIEILEAFRKRDAWGKYYDAFKVVTVGFPGNERPVGNKSSIGRKQLGKRYREVTGE